MRYQKSFTPIAFGVAVVAASIAAIVVTNNRATVARAMASAAESREVEADKQLKIAKANEAAEASRAAAAAAAQKKAEADLEIKKSEEAKSVQDAKAAAAALEKTKLEAETQRNSAEAARDLRLAEQKKAEAAKAEFERERQRIEAELAISNAAVAAVSARLEIERRKTEAIISEAKALELRKIDFERIERDLVEYKQELDERERALHPDITIYDSSNVTWVAEREADVIGDDTNRLLRVTKILPEDNPRLPAATRVLAKEDRLNRQSVTNRMAVSKARILSSLERMRDEARREGRVTDANFYQKSIKSLYPDYQQ